MSEEVVCIDGEMAKEGLFWSGIDEQLRSNFIYQKIHALDHNPLHIEQHIEILKRAAEELFGQSYFRFDAGKLKELIPRLIHENRYQKGSHQVNIYIFPPSGDGKQQARYMLSCEKQLLYRGYVHWHSGAKAVVRRYEYPHQKHRSAISLISHHDAAKRAKESGYDAVINTIDGGAVVSVGENPIFGLAGRKLYTTPMEQGAVDSVERRLGIRAAFMQGIAVVEQQVNEGALYQFEEMFYINTQGVVSIAQYAGRTLPHSMSQNIANKLNQITLSE